MRRYQGFLIWWGPVILTLGICAGIFWQFRPNLSRIKVPRVPPIYQEVPQIPPEKIKYVPAGPIRIEGLSEPSGRPAKPSKKTLKIATTYELKAILQVGSKRICKFEDRFLKEGEALGPFIIKKIGENYVEIYGKGKSFKVLVGEKLIF